MPNICKAFEELGNVLIYKNEHLVLCQESSLMAHDFMVGINLPQAWRAEMGGGEQLRANAAHDIHEY